MSCPYYTFRENDYYCQKKSNYVNSDTYYRYCRNYSYDECPIYKQTETSNCYLTTIVCNILHKKDDDQILNTLRNFRDNVLQRDKKYYKILKDYDTIGPIISEKIANDKDKLLLSKYLYQSILIPTATNINNNNYEKAITIYEIMTLSLINYYGLKHQYNSQEYSQIFNPSTAGHGLKKQKTITS